MKREWTFGRRLAAAFGLAVVILAAIGGVAYWSTNTLIDNNRWVDHTYQVRTGLADLLSTLKDAETGQRGYIITGDDGYLQPYTSGARQAKTLIDAVRTLTADNPDQQRRFATLASVIDAKLAELAQTIDLRRTQGFDAALKVVANNAGKTEMDQIRSIIGDADQEETSLLHARSSAAEASARFAVSFIIWGSLLGAVAVGLIGWFMTRALTRQIGGAVGHVRSSSAELQSAANQQASGMKEQTISMNEIATTISELLSTSRQIAESSQRVAQIAEQTASAARTGDGTVDKAHESITGIKRQVDQIVGHMLELGKKSQQIGSVLDIVSELAEQTNILSINATIEAAGAGEAGKRFAIVADEIRKLADRVAGSAKEVRGLIDDVRSSVNTTVMATETGSKAVDAGSRQFSDVAAAFKAIASLVSTTTEAAREIELSTKQQTTAVEQVNVAISNVTQAARETEASTTQTLETASLLAVTSSDLLRLVQARAEAA
jgi:methyl-accepting chemotaxis protein